MIEELKRGIADFKLIKSEDIKELKYVAPNIKNPKHKAYELKHKSGAKLLYLQNDDPEKSFCIGFKTLPKDSTGVFHILEHSVLCGSRKFPVKEPFTNLLKSSMQTFLNAMTFPDKTVYPVASTNEKDLYNLIDVYMDAVFFPNIYKNKNIFYQEGGHQTIKTENNKKYIDFNGVVYNEMKGVYSEPEEHLFEGITSTLFKDSCYENSSGGSPDSIKTLTYEEYLAQHNKNYQLDNSYIVIYGDLDICKMLEFLNDNYLSKQDEINKWRECSNGNFDLSSSFNTKTPCKNAYKKIEVKTSKENACSGCAFVINKDQKELAATKILLSALASSNESPLKAALLKRDIAADITFEMINELNDPIVYVGAKSTKKPLGEDFRKIIIEEFANCIKQGISKDLLRAAISNCEYKLKDKEADCTNGLDNTLAIFNYWLYDESQSTTSLKYYDLLDWIKEQVDTDYFEKLADKLFINNTWNASVDIIPCDKEMYAPLQESSDAKQKEIELICQDLEKWQGTPDSPEQELKLPVLSKSDLGDATAYPKWEEVNDKVSTIFYDCYTNGITYVNRYYSLDNLSTEDLPYVSILSNVLAKLDTEKHSSKELDLIGQSHIGSLLCKHKFFQDKKDKTKLSMNFFVSSSALDENIDYLACFIDEIIHETKFENKEKIRTILMQTKVGMEQTFIRAGHAASIGRAMSHVLPINFYTDKASGIDYYFFIKDLVNNFDERSDELIEKLENVSKIIFSSLPIISFMGNRDNLNYFISKLDLSRNNNLNTNNWGEIKLKKENEAFVIPSNVHYCGLANTVKDIQNDTNVKYGVGSIIMSLEYLWNEVRVKNGAYGAGVSFNKAGNITFYSYRDPKVEDTYNNYLKACKWLSDIELDEQKLDNFIICTVAKVDAPCSNKYKMLFQDCCHFSNVSTDQRLKDREKVINTTINDLHEAGNKFYDLANSGVKCVFGGPDLKERDLKDFKVIDLFND